MNKTWLLFFRINVGEFSMKINRSTRNSNKKGGINNILKGTDSSEISEAESTQSIWRRGHSYLIIYEISTFQM